MIRNIFWSGPHKPNWGDLLNDSLYKEITGASGTWVNVNHNTFYYMSIGSVLEKATPQSIIWGSGFMYENSVIDNQYIPSSFNVKAVRGPLSRKKLLNQGIDCPEVYGDPALLYPRFYNPSIKKKYKYGIIPHYADWDNEIIEKFKNREDEGIKVINILNENVNEFVDEVLECEVILSSSLHGIICGDAYGIPSYWIEVSDNVLGNGFKFRDYFASVKRTDTKPYINKSDLIYDLSELKLPKYEISIDLDKLLNACPFKNETK